MEFNKYISIIFQDISTFGGLVFYLFLCLLFFLLSEITLTIKLLSGLIILYIIVNIARAVYFKERPQKQNYNNIIEKIDASSFPSMHASRASFLFFILYNHIRDIYLITLFFIIFILVCYSRIYLKKHYLIDVLGGIIIGVIVGYATQLIL